jgi:hypothetical protein
MARLSAQWVAQVCIGILLVVIVRSLGEYFRLQYLYGDTLLIGQVTPYVVGALFAAFALALALICYLAGLYHVAIGIAAATVVLLFIYKVAVIG